MTIVSDNEQSHVMHNFSRSQTPKRLPCILLTDGDPMTITVLNDTFQSGYEVLFATDGVAGLASAAV